MNQNMSIMVVDDELVVRESLYHWFSRQGYTVEKAASGDDALKKLEEAYFDTLFVDMKMPGMGGFELLEKVKERYPDTAVIIITAYGSIDTAVQAMKTGASDYLLKPFQPEQLALVMEKISHQKKMDAECRYLKDQLSRKNRFDNIIGESDAMTKVYSVITEVAATEAPVLILGETGTGKELVAKAIHAKSLRKNFPFVPINCGALPDSLLESELFGYNRGAFTGAVHTRKGFLEVVSGGTLFLDEIGEISQRMQVALLRVLEDNNITRLGESRPIAVDFRLICATRQNLEEKIASGRFRKDFFYRVNVIAIEIPPLRRRREDIPFLVQHFIEKYSQETAKKVDRVDKKAMEYLTNYDWPGNVRELENAIERAVVLSKSSILTPADFEFIQIGASSPGVFKAITLNDIEREHIKRILCENQWNISKSSTLLGISRATLHRMVKRHGLEKS